MKIRQYSTIAVAATTLMIFILSACGGGSEDLPATVSYSKWDNPIAASELMTDAYDDSGDSVLISSGTEVHAHDDIFYIEDYNSTDKIIHVVDIPGRRYLGAFGKFGEGPTEIINPGTIFTTEDGRLAVFDFGHWNVKTFDVDSALRSEDYIPHTLVDLSAHAAAGGFPDRFVYVNNGRGFARLIKTKEEGGYTQTLCSFDLTTGAIELFGAQDNPPRFKSSVAASYADSVVAELSSNQDFIRLYDLNGKLKRTVKGPMYDDQPSRGVYYYSNAVIGDGKLFAVYSGERDYAGKQIVVFSLEGEYLRSYNLPDPITDISYSDKYNRLYLSLDGDRQFVYLPLGEEIVPIDGDSQSAETAESEKSPKKAQESAILTLIDPDDMIETVPVKEGRYRWAKSSEAGDAVYQITVFNQTASDTIKIDSITADIQCRIQPSLHRIIPKLMFLVTLTPESPIPSGSQDVNLTIHYDHNKQQTLSVKLLNEPHPKSPIKTP